MWPLVSWERCKFLLWAVRNPRMALTSGRYWRAVGMHLSSDDRFRRIW